nr:Peptide G protein-coupled receptor [Hymenolepis microstoma]
MDDSTVPIPDINSGTWELAYSYPIIVLLSVSYATIFIAGLLGNFAVITIILRNHQMRSVTNIFICNLSLADLLVTVFVEPLTLLQNIIVGWHWGAAACWCVPYLQGISVCASSLSLLVIAIDRYLAVCFPMKRLISRSLAKKIIVLIWFISAALFIPWAYYYRLSTGPDEQIRCLESWPSVAVDRAFFLGVVTLLVYTTPLLFMAYCYCSIILRVWMRVRKEQSSNGNANVATSDEHRNIPVSGALYVNNLEAISEPERETGSDTCCYAEAQRPVNHFTSHSKFTKSENKGRHILLHQVGGLNRVKTLKIIKMLAIVVINFCICWLPLFTIFNILKFDPYYPTFSMNINSTSELEAITEDKRLGTIILLIPFAQLLGSANSCVNPWIYCFYSKRYRRGFKRVFSCRSIEPTSMGYPPRLHSASAHFDRDHNLALRAGVDHSAYT